MPSSSPKLRVCIQQTVIPLYAVPLFEGIGRAAGIDLTVTYSTAGNALRHYHPEGVRTVGFNSRTVRLGPMSLMWDDAQWALAARGACDVLVLEWNARFLSLVPAILRARFNGIRTVLWGHGYSKRPSRIRDALREIPTWFASCVLLYEAVTAQRYKHHRLNRADVRYASNSLSDELIGAAIETVLQDKPALSAFRERHGLQAGNTLLFIGRLYAENDLDFLLNAFALVIPERPHARLVVIGDDKIERPRLERLAESLGVSDSILWAGALYDEAQIAPWALCADLFVYPKNVGLSLIHAFNYGLPVLAAGDRRHHNPEIYALAHNENGVFVDGERPADYAQAIVALLSDDARRTRLSDNARETVATQFNMRNMVAQFVSAIRGD